MNPMYFETEKIALELGIKSDVYHQIKKDVEKEFSHDEMMVELHLLRAIMEYSQTKKNYVSLHAIYFTTYHE
jgi:hypothetical protein